MSRATRSRVNRMMFLNIGTKEKPIKGKFIGVDKPVGKKEIIVDLPRGAKMRVMVSPGQLINVKKEFERAIKRGDVIYPPEIAQIGSLEVTSKHNPIKPKNDTK